MNRSWVLLLAGLALLAATDYQSEIALWRSAREAHLKAEGGWLSLAGLFWLNEGANPFGTDPANRIALGDGPARAGVFELHGGKVTVLQDGRTRELKPDSADAVTAGRLSLFVIRRGGKYGIRVKDPESRARREFHGLSYWAAREEYRVTARFTPAPREIPITNVLGQTEPMKCPGYVTFRLAGRQLRLYPVLEDPQAKELFFIFRDQTSGKETYGAARFLDSELPRDGKVALDFNKAYNPPCAFTPYATCPLPPPENRLPVRIEAGEKKYGH